MRVFQRAPLPPCVGTPRGHRPTEIPTLETTHGGGGELQSRILKSGHPVGRGGFPGSVIDTAASDVQGALWSVRGPHPNRNPPAKTWALGPSQCTDPDSENAARTLSRGPRYRRPRPAPAAADMSRAGRRGRRARSATGAAAEARGSRRPNRIPTPTSRGQGAPRRSVRRRNCGHSTPHLRAGHLSCCGSARMGTEQGWGRQWPRCGSVLVREGRARTMNADPLWTQGPGEREMGFPSEPRGSRSAEEGWGVHSGPGITGAGEAEGNERIAPM